MKRQTEHPAVLVATMSCLLLLAAPAIMAQPIDLDADQAEIDNARGVSVYTGNVVLTRGFRRITGERMTVHLSRDDDGDQALDHVVIEGEPAVYSQEASADRRAVEAEAPRMEYFATGPERVVLLNGARLVQGRNTFSGERIEYEIVADVVNARGEPETGQRVQITLFPDDADEEGDGE